MKLNGFCLIDRSRKPESNGVVLAGTNINWGKVSKMKFRFYKQTRWFEAYFETLSPSMRRTDCFYDRLSEEDGTHQFWFGRFYFTIVFLDRFNAAQLSKAN